MSNFPQNGEREDRKHSPSLMPELRLTESKTQATAIMTEFHYTFFGPSQYPPQGNQFQNGSAEIGVGAQLDSR